MDEDSYNEQKSSFLKTHENDNVVKDELMDFADNRKTFFSHIHDADHSANMLGSTINYSNSAGNGDRLYQKNGHKFSSNSSFKRSVKSESTDFSRDLKPFNSTIARDDKAQQSPSCFTEHNSTKNIPAKSPLPDAEQDFSIRKKQGRMSIPINNEDSEQEDNDVIVRRVKIKMEHKEAAPAVSPEKQLHIKPKLKKKSIDEKEGTAHQKKKDNSWVDGVDSSIRSIKSKSQKRRSLVMNSSDEELQFGNDNYGQQTSSFTTKLNKSASESEKKVKKEESSLKKSVAKKIKREESFSSETPSKVKKLDDKKTSNREAAIEKNSTARVKKEYKSQKSTMEDSESESWKWWKEEPHPDGVLWLTLTHNGPCFAPSYGPLPENIRFYYDGKPVKLSLACEEMATFYAKMLDHDYTSKDIFNKNFFEDWRMLMTSEEKKQIMDFSKCDFREMHTYFLNISEQKKNISKEEKDLIKQENTKVMEHYGYCEIDGHKQKVGNFRIEPPGLFRGRGDHPKQGRLKKRVLPEDITINIGENCSIPEPPDGHKWKNIQHDNKVSWLASWVENISGGRKYVMLNPTAKIKGEKDMAKFDVARKLRDHIDEIRKNYKNDWNSDDMKVAQRAVCLYLIDKLALRAGHEKEEGEAADTVGCCSLRVEHIKLHKELDDQKYVVEFDFLGKDSVRYVNKVSVKKKVFRNLHKFQLGKELGTDLFDKLSTISLNKYLGELMPGLTAKVFRTYNASSTLQEQLEILTDMKSSLNEKILSYNRANRAVAILCNHQRAIPKTFDKAMENLTVKIKDKKKEIKETKKEISSLKSSCSGESKTSINALQKSENKLKRLNEQLLKLNIMVTEKDENKTIALGTSKLNYLDPRISIAWCKKFDVPVEKIFTKTHREKFQWAIDMTEEDFVF